MQIPGIQVRVRHRHPWIVGDDLLVDGLYRLGVCLHPADLQHRALSVCGSGLFIFPYRRICPPAQDVSITLCECQLDPEDCRFWNRLNVVFMRLFGWGLGINQSRKIGIVISFVVVGIHKQNRKAKYQDSTSGNEVCPFVDK